MKEFFEKLIPKNRLDIAKSIDYSSLIAFIHIDKLIIQRKLLINDYLLNVYFVMFINVLDQLTPKIYIQEKRENEEKIHLILHFNIGVILINYLRIRRKYFHGKKQNI